MRNSHVLLRWISILFISLLLTNCGGGGGSNTGATGTTTTGTSGTISGNNDDFSRAEYRGLTFYHKNMPSSNYKLTQLTNSKFNALKESQKLQVADKLLSTLFFGYPLKELKEKINSDTFINEIKDGLDKESTDKEWLENYILDEEKFTQYDRWNEPQAINILSRFYAMKDLDSYFLKNWVAYILTQTIMFSPAYELETTHTPNIARVYNRIVTMLNVDSGMRYITYVHMMSEDNWRRFRSPEDNGREMLEIYLFDMDDKHVPIAAKALQNWKLNTDSDTLEVSLNQNTKPLDLFGTKITNGDDFYRELAKSNAFTKGVTKRLVSFFFPGKSDAKIQQIIDSIISSKPEAWQDILLQIVFSEEYLLHNQRAKSAEETFFSLAKKMDYKHRKSSLAYFKESLEEMHQATMKYKLGKLKRVPQDTLSFAYYHKYIRENILLRTSNPEKIDDFEAWDRQGWDKTFVSDDNFHLKENNATASLESLIEYLFQATIARSPKTKEMALFKAHMLRNESESNQTKVLNYAFDLLEEHDDAEEQQKRRERRKENIAILVLDYISRLSELYTIKEVK
jgi:hypothetical protein